METTWSSEDLFRWFVIQQQQVTMIHLGKMVHPATSKIERDLDAARFSIDLLGMLEEKTKGNLNADEERLLGQVLTTLRLNFVEESGRAAAAGEAAGGEAGQDPPAGEESGAGSETSAGGSA
jgi:hypothetical protein